MVMFTIPGRLPGYNELHNGHWTKTARVKKEGKELVQLAVFAARPRIPKYHKPVSVRIECFEPNERRDPDNVCSGACKIILDALQDIKVLEDDDRKHIAELQLPRPAVDRNNPRIEVTIEESEVIENGN